jgi:hypothetical protein
MPMLNLRRWRSFRQSRDVAKCVASAARRPAARRLGLESLEPRSMLAVLTVGPLGSYPTIQHAVDHARPSDVIIVSSGIYAESVDLSRMGSALAGLPGSLTIRGGAGAAAVVSAAAGSAAFFNSVAFSGDVVLESLTLGEPGAGTNADGVRFDQFAGDLQIRDMVFQELSGRGVVLTGFAGGFSLTDSLLDRVGAGNDDAAVQIIDFHGVGTITGNRFQDVTGTAIELRSRGSEQASWLVAENQFLGDGDLFDTTRTGIRVRLQGSSETDLTLDTNSWQGLSGAAIDAVVAQDAQWQTRWVRNVAANLDGPALVQVSLQERAQAALLATTNSWTDSAGAGMTIQVHDAARLRAVLQDEAFITVGDGAGENGLAIATSPSASGSVDVRLEGNTFASIGGDGLRLQSEGTAAFRAALTDNFFSETNILGGVGAVVVRQAADAAAAVFDLRMEGNHVFDNQANAYLLQRDGNGALRLEGQGASAATALALANSGQPTLVTGEVGLIAPGTLDSSIPSMLGGRAWRDADGDGIQDAGEGGIAGVRVLLSGTETGGAAVDRSTQTDSSGGYAFSGLNPGQYTLTLAVPAAQRLAPMGQGGDADLDSDFEPLSRQTHAALNPAQDALSFDAGLMLTWQNPRDPRDVNGDGLVLPLDVLLLINDINARGIRPLPIPPPANQLPPPYLDVDGDDAVTPQDVLIVINHLNSLSALAGSQSGEGETPGGSAQDGGTPHAASSLLANGRGSDPPPPGDIRLAAGRIMPDRHREPVENKMQTAEEYRIGCRRGGEKMGLASSGNSENPGKSAVAKVPVPFFPVVPFSVHRSNFPYFSHFAYFNY